MRRMGKRLAALLLAMILAAACILPAAGQENKGSGRVVRVAYPIQTGLTEVDDAGNYFGYTYEYLQEIAQFTGWTYEFVRLAGETNEVLSTMLDMVETGEIDVMGGIMYSEQLAETYDYAGNSYGTVHTLSLIHISEPTRP